MRRHRFCIGVLLLVACGYSPARADSAPDIEKSTSTAPSFTDQLKALHKFDLACQDLVKADEDRKNWRDLLESQHHALPPVGQEAQHLSTEQRHDVFINEFTFKDQALQDLLKTHADVEAQVRSGNMKSGDIQAAIKKWKSDSVTMRSALKSIGDQFVQIGQDYLEIFQDHRVSPPIEAERLANQRNAMP
jgi:hypothetical protein